MVEDYMAFLARGNRMEYLTSPEMSELWGISSRRISLLCAEGRIEGAIKKGKTWLIPSDTQKPADARYKGNKIIRKNLE